MTQTSACAIGLMSGTSADGIDGVALELRENGGFAVIATCTAPYPQGVRRKIRAAAARRIRSPAQSGSLDLELAHLFAAAAELLIAKLGHRNITVVGSHGQTVNHSPDTAPPFTVQLGSGRKIAELLGLPVVSNFRDADLQAGGQGAPLVPAFHHAAFASAAQSRAVINIGGIANLTFLPRPPGATTGFDTGPGNTLLDGWCHSRFQRAYDANGDIARQGALQPELLDRLLADPYFSRPPPKSTGLDYFNAQWLEAKLRRWQGYGRASDQDILMTLTGLTAASIAAQVNRLHTDRIWVCGGGARNTLLLELLNDRSAPAVAVTSELGIDPQWVEAAAFAWMACRTINGLTSTLPAVTGAAYPAVAGIIHNPDRWQSRTGFR